MTTPPTQGDTGAQLRRALTALKDLRTRLEAVEGARSEPVAIIGMGCRFPGAPSPQAFWALLRDGVDAIRPTPGDRWDAAALYDADPEAAGRVATRWGGFLDAIDQFDAAFFGIAPREAAAMDPQQRLLLEVAWEALEDGGQTIEALAGSKTGVFVGVHSHSSDYYLMQSADPQALDMYSGTGTSHSVVSGRLSYLLDLRGPSIALDTACSSSLVAVHLAVQSLRSRECSLALAGGVNSIIDPTFTIAASRMHMLAADGRCKPFDAAADGFVRSEGCGLVLLKRLADAVADGDRILAVIRGSAVNQDGRTNGLTAPNSLSQQAVISTALANAGLAARQLGLIEAHGTGTPLGDPIEVEALSAVFGPAQAADHGCALGSAKANIGHMEGAAGVAGLIKAVLTLQHGLVPPLLHFRSLNPHLTLADTPFVIPTTARPWPAGETPRYAGISSFGWSGTNAHVIIGEAPQAPPSAIADPQGPYLLPISARSPAALCELARAYQLLLADEAGAPLADICAGAAMRRSHHEERLAAVGHSRGELAGQLAAFLAGEERQGLAVGSADPLRRELLAFVFPGQGAQWPGMARQLLAQAPTFRAAIERCERAFAPYVDWSLVEQLTAEAARLDEIDVIQPALFAIQVGLAALWRSWGVEPDAVVGHSMGEVAAAHVAGILSLDDAARIICRRSRLLRRVSGRGAMAVVALTAPEAEQAIAGLSAKLAVAVSNSRHSTVLSGDPLALAQVLEQLRARDRFCRLIKVDVASHSPQVDELLPELLEALKGLDPQAGTIPLYSTVTGEALSGERASAVCGPAYWADNLRRPVRFLDSVQSLLGHEHYRFVELSPHPILLAAIDETLQHTGVLGQLLPSLQRDADEAASMLASLGKLYSVGVPINWRALYGAAGKSTSLPTYPWQRTRYWLAPRAARPAPVDAEQTGDTLLGRRLPALAPLPGTKLWAGVLDATTAPTLLRGKVERGAILAGAVYAWLGLQAAAEASTGATQRLRKLVVRSDLPLASDERRTIQVALTPGASATELRIYSRADDSAPWVEHADGWLDPDGGGLSPTVELAAAQAACASVGAPRLGFAEVRLGAGQALARLDPANSPEALAGPAALAAGIALLSTLGAAAEQGELVLAGIDAVTRRAAGTPAWAYVRSGASDELGGDLYLLDARGQVSTACVGVTLRRPSDELRTRIAQTRLAEWLYELEWRPLAPTAHARSAGGPGRWLIFADADGLAAELAKLLAADGAEVTLVYPGPAYERAADGSLRVDAGRPDELRRVVETARAGGAPLDAVVYLWGLDLGACADGSGEELLVRQRTPTGGALHLAQALAREPGAALRLWLVTRGAVAAGGPAEPAVAQQAALWGLGRVIANEHPELWGGLIDLGPEAGAAAAQGLYDALLAGDGEDQVALRDGARRGARLARARFTAGAPARLRPDATYLITGGLGGLGLVLARWMLANGARSLALLGRRPLDQAAAQALHDLARDGARIVYLQADVADSAALAAALAQLAQTMPPLRGIVHAAGVLDDAALLGQRWEGFTRVMSAKLAGAWNLHRQTAGLELDLFVLCSSASALLGTPGQANYAAANAFLDALAQLRRAAGLAALSIDWGRWGEVGLATEATRSQQLERRGIAAMAPALGAAAFGRLLGHAGAQVTLADIDWQAFLGQLPRTEATPLFRELAGADTPEEPAAAQADLLRAIEQALPVRRYELLLEHVRGCVAAVLRFEGVEQVVPGQGFFQLGMDSLTALELKNRLGRSLGRAFPSTLTFDYPTAAALTRHLLAELVPATADAPPATSDPEAELAALEQLTRDDLKALLDAELDAIDL